MSTPVYREMPKQERLREVFDCRDGELFYKQDHGRVCAGDRAGGQGQKVAVVDGCGYPIRRLVWAWHYGMTPTDKDVVRLNGDNRIENLRLATRSESCHQRGMKSNNRSGLKGVCFIKESGKWRAQISAHLRKIVLGNFDTKEQAHAAYCAAAEKYFGELANFGTSQKDTPPSSGQMTEGAGASGMDTMAQGANEANHSVALTDKAPAVQVPEHSAHRAAKRQTRTAEGVTGARFCKRCAGHRKSLGGLVLSDATKRQYWVCQPCCEKFQARRPADSARANAGREQA